MGCSNIKAGKTQILNNSKENSGLQFSQFVYHKTTPIIDEYYFGQKLGQGATGAVWSAIHKSTNQKRAIKIIKKLRIQTGSLGNSCFQSEIEILIKSDHPNILKIHEYFEDENCFYIVTELMHGGELFDYIMKHKILSESIAADFLAQILSAVAYCHKNGIVHRDLKPQNIMLDKDHEHATLKIIDFGYSKFIINNSPMSTTCGTCYYIAPEVVDQLYNQKCDIWSCGVILYILLSGRPPFPGRNDAQIIARIKSGQYNLQGRQWDQVSFEAKQLIRIMLSPSPADRPSASDIINNPWLKNSMNIQHFDSALHELYRFRELTRLQQAVMAIIIKHLLHSDDTIKLNRLFKAIDTDNSGAITKDELVGVYMRFKNCDLAEVERIMRTVDINKNGMIQYSEFIMAAIQRDTLLSRSNLETAFIMCDKDNNGMICIKEVQEIIKADSNVDLDILEMMRKVDTNGDGKIGFDEFLAMMQDIGEQEY